jgi:hypothetical protein
VVWLGVQNLQALGRGYVAMDPIMERSQRALVELMAAQEAVAESDFATSSQKFANAQEELIEARQKLREALSVSRIVLEVLDVTGTVRSGDNILAAAERVTEAGQRVSEGMTVLLESSGSMIGDNDGSSRTLVGALEVVQEEMSVAQALLEDAMANMNKVNTLLLPSSVKKPAKMMQEIVPALYDSVKSFNDQSDLLLAVLGAEKDRQYLLVFQNNHEIRPTGGFIGSLGIINVDRGRVEDVDIQTVYDPDGQLKEYIAPPDPMRGITDRWYLRDSNWFVDFELSAEKIRSFFGKEDGLMVDGIIAITPEVVRRLLEVTGPIELPAYDVVVDSENFVALTQDQVTYSYDKEANRPKQFLADLTPLLLNRVFASQNPASMMSVLGVMDGVIREKHLLVNLTREDEQARVRELNWSGSVARNEQGFLYVNNANIGGHKSDQFVDQEIDYRSDVRENGDVEVTLTIRRTHNGPIEALDFKYPEGENPAYKDNIVWQRVLVPEEAELVEARGFTLESSVPKHHFDESPVELKADPELAEWQRSQKIDESGTVIGQEAGYRFFANWIVTKPGATTVGMYRYVIPKHANLPGIVDPIQKYRVYVAKQPGDDNTKIRVEIRLPEQVRIVHNVPHDGITQISNHEFSYRGLLKQNVLVGTVFETE